MNAYEIQTFRERLAQDRKNLNSRRLLHEQYEWLESYWKGKYKNNYIPKFSSDFNSYYWRLPKLRKLAREFASYPPVGNSERNFEPSESVRKATFYLRYHLDLFDDVEMPSIESEREIGATWGKVPLEAILIIVKQIRDNLFHGRKMELEEIQYQRNKDLVEMSKNVTIIILDELINAENSLH